MTAVYRDTLALIKKTYLFSVEDKIDFFLFVELNELFQIVGPTYCKIKLINYR